jgi:RimJ/RimL family protein N-acetyltransferase
MADHRGRPVGDPVPGFVPPDLPGRVGMVGSYVQVEPLDPERHAGDLFRVVSEDDGGMWTYMSYGPFGSEAEYRGWAEQAAASADPQFFALVADGEAQGVASYLRITPAAGTIEVGHIAFSPRLQRTPAATEAMYLMMRNAFVLGYRRYEWKCDALNHPSRVAAERLGFTFEGIHRQAMVVKGRNRDTAWYSVLDREWPVLREAFEAWLDPANFDGDGRQRRALSDLVREARERFPA